MAKTVNIANDTWFAGADVDLRFDVVQSDGTTPQTMTGWTLEFVLRETDSGAQVLKKTTTITIGNGAGTNDRATVPIARADTLDLGQEAYTCALWRTDTGNNVLLAQGPAVITRPPAQ